MNVQIQAILNDVSENSKSKIRRFLINNIESIAITEYKQLSIDQDLTKKINSVIEKINF